MSDEPGLPEQLMSISDHYDLLARFFQDVDTSGCGREHFLRAKDVLVRLEDKRGRPRILQRVWSYWLECGLERFAKVVEYYDDNHFREKLNETWLTHHLLARAEERPGSDSLNWLDICEVLHPERLGDDYPVLYLAVTGLLRWLQWESLDLSLADLLRADSQPFPMVLPILDWLEVERLSRKEFLADL